MTCTHEPIYTWIAADGTQVRFDADHDVPMLLGSLGLDAPPTSLRTSPRFATAGSALANRRTPERPFVLNLMFDVGPTRRVGDLIESTAVAFMQGQGRLRRDDGTNIRELVDVEYESGLEGNDSGDVAYMAEWRKYPCSFIALDPWWYGQERAELLDFGDGVLYDDPTVDYDDPNVSYDGSGTKFITVDGAVAADPRIVIRGPFSSGLRVDVDSGDRFTLSGAVGANDVVSIDTRRDNRGPRLNGGPIDWSLLTVESSLFQLQPGARAITAAALGFTGASSIEFSWRERFLTP